MMGDFMRFYSDEPLDVLLNPHRVEEQDKARAAGAARLADVGVRLTGTETSDQIGDLLDAVERFEAAVEAAGGDLMVDEGPHGHTEEPDNPAFVLPARGRAESVAEFAARVLAASNAIRHGGAE
jgi:hypothetical protein